MEQLVWETAEELDQQLAQRVRKIRKRTATAVVNDLFPKIKGTITSLVMIASSLCNYTILTAAAKMTSTSVIMMNIVITAIGILLALFVNVRYGVLLKNAEEASKN